MRRRFAIFFNNSIYITLYLSSGKQAPQNKSEIKGLISSDTILDTILMGTKWLIAFYIASIQVKSGALISSAPLLVIILSNGRKRPFVEFIRW